MTDTTSPTRDLARETFLTDCAEGFDHGNYAQAYETQRLSRMLRAIADKSDAYRYSAVLGFLASYERHEMTDYQLATLEEALATPAGEQCLKAGYCDGWDE